MVVVSGEVVGPLERPNWEEKRVDGDVGVCSLDSATCDMCAANCHKGDPVP